MKVPDFTPSAVRGVKIDRKVPVNDLTTDQVMFEFAHLMAGHMQNKESNGVALGLPTWLVRRRRQLARRIYRMFF